jgi:autotransporter-associated beta strand protein
MKTTTTKNYKIKTGLLASALCLLAGGLILLSPVAARAQDQSGTWKKTDNGDWSDSNHWVDALVANGAGKTCVGQSLSSGTRTITLDGDRTIGNFYMDVNGSGRTYVLAPLTGTETLTLSGANELTSLNGPFVVNTIIAGTGGLRARPNTTGPTRASVVLGATNIYTGNTVLVGGGGGGNLKIANVGAIPHGVGKGNVVIALDDSYGTLDLLTNSITINGLSGDGGQVLSSSDVGGISTLTVGDNNASGDFAGTIDDASGGSSPTAVALTKIGSGTLTLSGLGLTGGSTYSGDTTVDEGTLLVNGAIGAGAAPSVVKVAESGQGGTLGGTGTIYGPVTVFATGKIGAGASAGILTIYGALDMSAPNTTCNWELAANSTATPGTDFDQIVLGGLGSDITDANLNIQFTGSATAPNGAGFWANNQSWPIISGAVTGNFKNIQNGTNAFGYFYTTVSGSGVTLNFVPSGPVSPQPRITSIPGAGTALVTVNYTNTVPTKTYFLRYKTTINGVWATNLPGKIAVGTSDSQTDIPLAGSQRYYQVYYQP